MQVSLHDATSDPNDGIYILVAFFDHTSRIAPKRVRSLLIQFSTLFCPILNKKSNPFSLVLSGALWFALWREFILKVRNCPKDQQSPCGAPIFLSNALLWFQILVNVQFEISMF